MKNVFGYINKSFKEMINDIKKTFVKNFNLKTIIVFCVVLLVFFFMDSLTKKYLFDTDKYRVGKDLVVFGIRSVPHGNSTLFSALDVNLPIYAIYIINFTIATILVIPVFFTRSIFLAVILAIMVSGVLGNSIDKLVTFKTSDNQPDPYTKKAITNYVRDIIYIPWLDKGTFNLADVWIVTGAGLLACRIIHSLFTHPLENKNN